MPLHYLPFLHALLSAALAVCVGEVLIQPGMLLHPVYFALYQRLERRFGNVEGLWWWKPLWGCCLCMAGQWAFWAYLVHARPYNAVEHLYTVAVALLAVPLLLKLARLNG